MTTERLQFEIQANTGALERIERSVRRIEKAAVQMGPRVTKGFNKINQSMQRNQKAANAAANATRKQQDQQKRLNNANKQGKTALDLYNTANQDLVKSVQLALGPLSGVAARLTALGALFNKNAAAIAALIASVVGFTAAVRQAITAGTNLEKQMLALDAVIEATGRSAETSADQLNQLALRLGEDTLGSAVDFRNSLAQLSTFTNIATEDFEELTQVASGMSEIMGGNMTSNIRRLGRLFDDIENNLSSLSRAGINFTQAEEQKLVQLERSGQAAEAHAMILERLGAFSDLATKQSQGLAGQMDTMRERFRAVLEQSSATSSMIDGLTDVMQRVNDAVQRFLDNEEAVERLGNAFNVMAQLVSNSLLFLVENASTLAHLFGIVLVGSVVKRLTPAFMTLVTSSGSVIASLQGQVTWLQMASSMYGRASVAAMLFGKALRSVAAVAAPFAIAFAVTQIAVNALSGSFDEAEHNAKKLRDVEESLADAKDRLTDSSSALAQALNEEDRARIRNVQTQLNAETERIALEQRRLQRQRDSLSLNDEEIRDTRQLNTEQDKLEKQITALEREKGNLADATKSFIEQYEEAAKASRNLDRVTRGLENSIFRLRREYDQAGLDVAQHQRDIQAVEAQYEQFKAVMGDLEEDELQRLAVALGASGNSAEEVEAAFKALKEAVRAGAEETDSASNSIDRMVGRFNALRDEITQTRAALAGDPLGFDMADFRQLEEFDNQQLLQIADQVGLFIRDEANAARELATALRDRQNFSNVLDELQQFEQDSRPEADAIREEFQHRRDVINQQMTLEVDERIRLMQLAHDAQAQQMREHARSMIDLEFEFNEFSQRSTIDQVSDHFKAQRDIIRENFEMEKALRLDMIREIREAEEKEKGRLRDEIVAEQISEQNRDVLKSFQDLAVGIGGTTAQQMAGINSALGAVTDTMGNVLGEQHSAYKDFATTQAIISGALAVNQVYADSSIPSTAGKLTAAALIGANTGAQVAEIRSQNFATGGMVRGPGTSRSDSIPANLSDGEFVMRAEAVRRIGANNLERMNEGNVPGFARGGAVGNVTSAPTINIISEGGNQVEMEEGVGANGEPEITARVKDATRDNMRRGRHDRDMRSNFGVKRQPIRR